MGDFSERRLYAILEKEIATLRAQVAERDAQHVASLDEWARDRDELRALVTALEEGLRTKYGVHKYACASMLRADDHGAGSTCDCGLSALLVPHAEDGKEG